MKTDKLFRFTMQIPATTPENCKVGDFLESLKNKKARFIVSVVSEYLDAHPEYQLTGISIERYLKDENTVSSAEELETAILFPVEKA